MTGMSEFEFGGLALLVVGSFAATNLDNLVLLVVLMGADKGNRAKVALGFIISAACILSLAAIGGAIGSGLDPALLGYLGLAPLLMGIYLLFQRIRGSRPEDTMVAEAAGAAQSGGRWFSTFLLMFSNSGDSLAIFFPLLMESQQDFLLWSTAIFLVTALLWVFLAWRLADQPRIAVQIEHLGEKLVPWMMIAAGIYILMNTATDTML